jgi:hypothetical protein
VLAIQGAQFYTNFKNNNMNTKELIAGFSQGSTSRNCVSVAVIKASVEVFGLTGIFQKVQRETDKTTVTLRDGVSVVVFEDDLALAKQKSAFVAGSDKTLYDFAVFAFAVMGKRAQKAHNDGANTFEEALDSLCDGEDYVKGPDWLGLGQYAQRIKKRDIWKYAGVVGASASHCYLASFGWQDKYGVPAKISQLEMLFNPSKYQYFYRITPTVF